METVKLAAPWTIFYRQIQTLFKKDPEVRVIYDEKNVVIKLYVDNTAKADALTQLLPTEKQFGNITVKIDVIPGNKQTNSVDLITDAFTGNGALSFIYPVETIFSNKFVYVVFKKEVVQFFNDDLSDIHGVCSTLYQDIAKEVLGNVKGVFFCTDTGDAKSLGCPLGEWP